MANQAGKSNGKVLRLDFDRRLMLHFGECRSRLKERRLRR